MRSDMLKAERQTARGLVVSIQVLRGDVEPRGCRKAPLGKIADRVVKPPEPEPELVSLVRVSDPINASAFSMKLMQRQTPPSAQRYQGSGRPSAGLTRRGCSQRLSLGLACLR